MSQRDESNKLKEQIEVPHSGSVIGEEASISTLPDDAPSSEVALRLTVSPVLGVVFYAAIAILAIVTAIQLIAGSTEYVMFNLIAIVVMPPVFHFLTNTKALFYSEGIEFLGRTIPWDGIEDLKIDEKNRRVFIEDSEGYIHVLRVKRRISSEAYAAVFAYARHMLTVAAIRAKCAKPGV